MPMTTQPGAASAAAPFPTPRPPQALADEPGPGRAVLRAAAAAGVLGLVLEVAMDHLHPASAQPNDTVAAFREYSRSRDWTAVHLGQLAAALLIMATLVTLARLGARQTGMAGALSVGGGVTAVLYAAVFAVQMAVDGVALKAAVHAWVSAPVGTDRTAAFLVADGLRSLEKGLDGVFQVLSGLTLLGLGLSIVLGRWLPRWLGWVATVAGAGTVAGGVVTAHTGFSPTASAVLAGPSLLIAVFLIGACVCLWRLDPPASDVP
jgi:hypothetical protein